MKLCQADWSQHQRRRSEFGGGTDLLPPITRLRALRREPSARLRPRAHRTILNWTRDANFHNINCYEMVQTDRDYVLVDRREDREFNCRRKLACQSVPGSNMKIRLLSSGNIMRHLQTAGFVGTDAMEEPDLEVRIVLNHPQHRYVLACMPPWAQIVGQGN